MNLKPGQWSRGYKVCLSCKTANHPYRANGFCKACYFREKYKQPKFKKQWIAAINKWRLAHKEQSNKIQHRARFKLFLRKYPKEAMDIIRDMKII